MSMPPAVAEEYPAEHAIANRLDGPVGREFARVSSDMEAMINVFMNDGSIDTHLIHMIRVGLDRLEKYGSLRVLQEELEIQARTIGRLAEALDNDKAAGAVDRIQRKLTSQCTEVIDLVQRSADA